VGVGTGDYVCLMLSLLLMIPRSPPPPGMTNTYRAFTFLEKDI